MIVRELLTRLGFQFDRSGLGLMEKAITGFKNRVVFTSRDIKDFGLQAAGYLGQVSAANVDVAELARNTNTSVERFVALRKAAEGFRLSPDQFDSSFVRLSELLREARSGYGELFDIIRKSRGELNLTPFIQQHDVEGAMRSVLTYVNSLGDATDKVTALRDVMSPGSENGFLRILDAGIEKFNEATEANKEFGKSFAEGIPEQQAYLNKITELSNKLDTLKQKSVQALTPLALRTFDFVEKGVEGIGIVSDIAEREGDNAGWNFVGQAIADAVYRAFGYTPLVDVKNREAQEDLEFQRRLFEYERQQRELSRPVTINNRVDVNVAPGTDNQQRVEIAEAVREEMQAFQEEQVREVISNYPQVE